MLIGLAGATSAQAPALLLPRPVKVSPLLERRMMSATPADRIRVRLLLWQECNQVNHPALPGLLVYDRNQLTYAEGYAAVSTIRAWLADDRILGADIIRPAKEEQRQEGLDLSLNEVLALRRKYPGLAGSETILSVKEKGFDNTDIDFRGRSVVTPLTPSSVELHATNMASIAAGGGVSDPSARGVAWKARITSSDFADLLPDSNAYFSAYGIQVQNHSYGTGVENYYGLETKAYDRQAIDRPALVHVFSSGNAGATAAEDGLYRGITGYANLTGQFKQAKHILTIGGTDSLGIRLAYSSAGPAYDGRVKPELMAYGHGGTSGAAALVSGLSLLLQEAWRELHDTIPSAELIRALLVHTARDLGPPGPDFFYGFGEVQALQAVEAAKSGHILQAEARIEPVTLQVDVPPGTAQLKATLVWTDPPAALYASRALVHDLDLMVEQVSTGQLFRPLVLNAYPHPDSLAKIASPGIDTLNPIEQVVIPLPVPGPYRIIIDPSKTAGIPQAFTCIWSVANKKTFSWVYPTAADGPVPSTRNILRWTASFHGVGRIEISRASAGTWSPVALSVDAALGTQAWSAPDVAEWAQLRWIASDTVYYSDTFLIAPAPRLSVTLRCPDIVGLSWTAAAGSDSFTVFRVDERYLAAYAQTTEDRYDDIMPDSNRQHYAVAAWYGGRRSPLTPGYRADTQGAGCYVDRFFYTGMLGDTASFVVDLSRPEDVAEVRLQRRGAMGWQDQQLKAFPPEKRTGLKSHPLAPGAHDFRAILRLSDGDTVATQVERIWYIPEDELLLYPNPVRSGIPLYLLIGTQQAYRIDIMDMTGKVWSSREGETYPEIIDTGEWPPGSYLVIIRRADGHREVKKILVLQ